MTKDLINRITYHLSSGGLFNPELADHLAVRNLLMECREALAQPEQEPVAWMDEEMTCIFFDAERPEPFDFDFWKPLYATPPQRKPLTAMEVYDVVHDADLDWHTGFALGEDENRFVVFARAIEAAHGIKGEA